MTSPGTLAGTPQGTLPGTPPGEPHRPARLVAVVGACGGAGASTVAATLTRTWRRRGPGVTLVDLDVPGAGVDVLLGIEDEPGSRWPDLTDARGTVDGIALLGTLPRWGSVPVLSGSRHHPSPPAADVVLDTTTALLRTGERVVLDASRPSGWTAATRSLLGAADAVVLVVPLTVPGVAGAVAATTALTDVRTGELLVVGRGPAPGRADPTGLARALDRPVDVVLGWEAGLATTVEHGAGPLPRRRGRLHRATTHLVDLVDAPRRTGPATRPVPAATR